MEGNVMGRNNILKEDKFNQEIERDEVLDC